MIRQIFQKLISSEKPIDVQELLDREKIRMVKTREVLAPDRNNMMSFTYRFYFDNVARKRRFLAAIIHYKTQEWDPWVRWLDEISQLKDDEGQTEITVEAQCLVPPDQLGRFRYLFEAFVAKELIMEK